jgi:serine/threonine-protein kinase
MAHIQEDVPMMKVFNPEVHVPAPLESVVRRCMAKDPAERYASMDEVLAALKQCSGITSTMSGEFRLADVMGPNGLTLDGANPSSSSVQLRGSLGAGTPYAGVASSTTPQGIAPVSVEAALPPPKSGKGKWLAAAALALAVAGGALGLSPTKSSLPEQPKAAAKQSAAVTPIEATTPAAIAAQPNAVPDTASVAQPPSAAAPAFTTVLVSLKSTPPGAMVAVGEREYGPTPTQVEWTGSEAAMGREITFRFQRKGYRDLTVTRQIRSDRLEVEAPPMDPIPIKRPSREERAPSAAAASSPKIAAPVTAVKGYKAEPY